MELIFNAVVGIIFLVFFVGGMSISSITVTGDVLGAKGFPMIFSAIGLLLLAFSTIAALRKKGTPDSEPATLDGMKRTGVVALLLSGYIMLVDVIGFTLAILLFMFFSALAIGYKNFKILMLFALLMTALLVVVFGKVFFIALPRGISVFKEISYYLY